MSIMLYISKSHDKGQNQKSVFTLCAFLHLSIIILTDDLNS